MQELIPPLRQDAISGMDKRFMDHILAGQRHGFFPVADSGFWHGGIHLEANDKTPVVAIADGELVAYRLNRAPRKGKLDDEDVEFSNSFVLLKHEFKTPNGTPIRFFSLYMHLLPLDTYTQDQLDQGPSIFLQKRYSVNTTEDGKGLAVVDEDKRTVAVIPREADFTVSGQPIPRNHWAAREGFVHVTYDDTDGYAKIRGNATAVRESTWRVKKTANDAPLTHAHYGINVRSQADSHAPVQRVAPKGQELQFKNPCALVDDAALTRNRYAELKTGGFVYFTTPGIDVHNAVPGDIADNVVKKPASRTIIRQGDILGYPGPYCEHPSLVHFEIFTDNIGFLENGANDQWGRRILKLKKDASLKKREVEKDSRGRRKVVFATEMGKAPHALDASEQGTPETVDGVVWHEVLYDFQSKKKGWIAENDPNVEAVLSPYDWKKLWPAPLTDDRLAEDGFVDVQKLFDELDTNHDKEFQTQELRRAYDDATKRQWLKHLICQHPTEWDAGQNGAKWERLRDAPWNYKDRKTHLFDQAKTHIDEMQWWTKANGAVPASPNIYHFHPIGFIEHTNMMAVPLTREEAERILLVVALGESKKPNPYEEINDDKEFKGEFPKLKLGYDMLAHVGLSYGFIQFQQGNGNLGRLLTLMHQRDPEAFKQIFGTNWQALLTLTTKGAHAFSGDDAALVGEPTLTAHALLPGPDGADRVIVTNPDSTQVKSSIDLWVGAGVIDSNGKRHGKSLQVYSDEQASAKKAQYDENTKAAAERRNPTQITQVKIPEFFGDRIRPLAIEHPTDTNRNPTTQNLWEIGKWRDRFTDAGKLETFKQAQRDLAFADFVKPAIGLCLEYRIRSAKGLAVAIDRCIQQGAGGARSLFAKASRNLSGGNNSFWPKHEADFLKELQNIAKFGGAERLKKLISGEHAHKFPISNFDIDTYQPHI